MYELMRVGGIVLMALGGVGTMVTLILWACMYMRGAYDVEDIYWDIGND